MAAETKSLPEIASELKDLLVDYAKQETIDPLKGLGRFVGFGVGGSILLGLGVTLLGLGLLRVLQAELDDTFDGNWSFAPYFITLAVVGVLIALAVSAINRGDRKEDRS